MCTRSDITVLLTLRGDFSKSSFVEWIVKRANVFSLTGWVQQVDDHSLTINASGHPVLIDALETACSLGPIDAQIDSIDREALESDLAATGFVAR